jgi:formylglycine-generating enzyme required for sulfatase activity
LPDGAIVTPDGSIVTPDGGPLGKCAPDQVDIDAGFCIDKTEVTNAAYVAFLEATGGDAGSIPGCSGVTIDPNNSYEILTALEHPVRGVTWCGARAYCEWAGKRLCGTITDGGELNESDNVSYKDAAASEWFFACSQNGAQPYPYGNTYDGGACNDVDFKEGGVVDVASSGCVGGYPGLNDMVGNVWEWQNACSDDTSSGANCLVQGGSYTTPMAQARCDQSYPQGRTSSNGDLGIRCCSNEK